MKLWISNLSQLLRNIKYIILFILILFGICLLAGFFIDINGGDFEESWVPTAHLFFCILENIFGLILLIFMFNNFLILSETIILLIINHFIIYSDFSYFHYFEVFAKNYLITTNIISIILVFIIRIINHLINKNGSNCT